ncbi:Mne1p [Saccharomyces eubayanus]|uniref:Mne1p n=1 Tax=Saccharomyces eubayanus TaxID=1080349 RepID=UPI0006C46E44|nr:MNE1-like protein [Saccharomyces eubayanus]KOG96822.1 MNE1-like protein [Saccharomyces eubayanus]
MKSTFKRFSSTHIGKLIKESLNTPEILPQLERKSSLHKHFLNAKRTNSITDKWLKDALTRKDKLHEDELRNVNLRLTVVLTTLQKLRTTYKPASYFALLNRIGTGHIKWLNKRGQQIDTPIYGRLPLEFYHELSNMLYSISLRRANDKIALAKFSLQLLDRYYYLKTNSFTGKKKFQSNPKFLRNCGLLAVKSESIYYLKAMQELFRENAEGPLLTSLTQLAFYVETHQWTNVLDCVYSCIVDFDSVISKTHDRDIQTLELFSSYLVKSLELLITQDMENEVCQILTSLSSRWNFHFDEHDSSNLLQLCENHSCFKIIETLNKISFVSVETRHLEMINSSSEMSLKQCVNFLAKRNFQPFEQKSFLHSLSFKLKELPLSVKVWEQYIDEFDAYMQAESISLPLRAFFVDILLKRLSTHRGFNFTLSIVEHMIYERNLWQPFLMTENIIDNKENSNFHYLFHAMSRAPSTKISLLTLFNRLKETGYQFSIHDFLSMLKPCKRYSDCDYFYFVFYNLLSIHSHKFLYFDKLSGKYLWRLPNQIVDAISGWLSNLEIGLQENTDRVVQITDDVNEWYVAERLNHLEETTIRPIDKIKLRNVFGEQETFFDMDSETFQDCEEKRGEEVRPQHSFSAKDGQYSLELDLSYSERIEDLLCYISSQKQQ